VTLAINEYRGHIVRRGGVYDVTFSVLGVEMSFEAEAAEGPDFPRPQNAEVIVRVSAASWFPTLVLLPPSDVVIASAPSNRLFFVNPE